MPEPYYEGDEALITSGPLAGKVGTIAKVDDLRQTVTLVVKIFERETVVDVAFMRLVSQDVAEAIVGEP